METKDEKLKQVDALHDQIIKDQEKSNMIYKTTIEPLSKRINSSESTIKSILETFPIESNPFTNRMLSLIDKRDGWTYDVPVIRWDGYRKRYHEYKFLYHDKPIYIGLQSDLVSYSEDKQTMECSLTYRKIIALKKEHIRAWQQVFMNLDWETIEKWTILKDVSESQTKRLDTRGLTDEQITAEFDKIEPTMEKH